MKTKDEILEDLKKAFQQSESVTITSIDSFLFGDFFDERENMVYVGDMNIFQHFLNEHGLNKSILEFSNGTIFQGYRLQDQYYSLFVLTADDMSDYLVNLDDETEIVFDGEVESPTRPVTGYMEVVELVEKLYEQWVVSIDPLAIHGSTVLTEDYMPNILSYKDTGVWRYEE